MVGISVILTLFIGVADIIFPSSIVKLYPSAKASTYHCPPSVTLVPITPTGISSEFTTSSVFELG